MIGKLTGIIDDVAKDSLILDVNGVGYKVSASPRTLRRIGLSGDRASLKIHTHVREDTIQLFGFCDELEQKWFNLLTTVQGVGNKVALALLGACPPEKLPIFIASQDKAAITQADGVGPKLATRILTELKDKAGDLALSTMANDGVVSSSSLPKGQATGLASASDEARSGMMNDAVSALVNLGYGRSEAYQAVSNVLSKASDAEPEHGNDIGKVIALGLKELTA